MVTMPSVFMAGVCTASSGRGGEWEVRPVNFLMFCLDYSSNVQSVVFTSLKVHFPAKQFLLCVNSSG